MRQRGLRRKTPLRAQEKSARARRATSLADAFQGRIRALKPSEPDPPGEPRRFVNGGGYVRLRWKVGKGEYVERYARDESGSLVRNRDTWKPGMPRKRPPLRVDRQEVARLHAEGKKQTEIAAALGCNAGTVSRTLVELGLKARRPIDYVALPPAADVRRLYVDDLLALDVVARELGSTMTAVKQVLRNEKIKVRKPGTRRTSRVNAFEREIREMRPHVVARSGGACEIRASKKCTGRGVLTHHRKMRSQGGDNSLENLMDGCRPCHGVVHRVGKPAYEHGWLVPSWANPAEIQIIAEAVS